MSPPSHQICICFCTQCFDLICLALATLLSLSLKWHLPFEFSALFLTMFAQRLDGVMSYQWFPQACRKNFKVRLQLRLVFDTWII